MSGVASEYDMRLQSAELQSITQELAQLQYQQSLHQTELIAMSRTSGAQAASPSEDTEEVLRLADGVAVAAAGVVVLAEVAEGAGAVAEGG